MMRNVGGENIAMVKGGWAEFNSPRGSFPSRALARAIAMLTLTSTLLGGGGLLPAWGQRASYPPNPLEMTEPDPLLPELVVDRPLSPQERRVLTVALNQLQAQGEQALQDGDLPTAFDIWNRELRLRRVLGVGQEVPALSRVGEVAWRENQVTEVRVITERLQEIEQEVYAQTPVNYGTLQLIADAYEKMRALDPAIALYTNILERARQQGDRRLQENTLLSLAQLNAAWFNYADSADAYRQLLALVEGNPTKEIEYLQQLAYLYEQSQQPLQAIAAQRRLVNLYQQQQNLMPIPALKLAIGNNYVALNRPDRAAPSYQEAFAVSRSTQQYGYARDALSRLADLYRSLDRPEDALVVYQLMIDVSRQSYDQLSEMNAYDLMGQIHRDLGRQSQAIASFRQGLRLAQALNYKVSYFNTQIETLSSPQPNPNSIDPANPQ